MAASLGDGNDPGFQIAPMIDVLLVLLIFFMSIASTAITRYDPTIQLPVAPAASLREDERAVWVVNVAWDAAVSRSSVRFEEQEIALPQLTVLLAERRSRGLSARLLIRGDGAVPVRHIQAVVAAAAAAGVAEITFAALRS
jgi:biopolymer transport protein ExbD